MASPEDSPASRVRLWPWTLGGMVLLVLAWQAGSQALASSIMLPGPLETASRLWGLAATPDFWLAALGTFLRVVAGLVFSVPLAVGIGLAAGLNRRVHALVQPLFTVIGATPVLSVILIAYFWFGQDRTPVFTAFLMIFPLMAATTLEGIRARDRRLEEALRAYKLPASHMILRFYLPTLVPSMLGGLRASLSLSWKVVVAAEILVQPTIALGTGMQNAKAQLEITELFAWTASTVILSGLTELLFRLGRPGQARPSGGSAGPRVEGAPS